MLYVEEDFARTLLKDAVLVLSASIDDCREPDNALNSIGKGVFNLYRLTTGQHLMSSNIVDKDFTEYNLLQTQAEVIHAFYNLGRGGEMSSYLQTLYRSEEDEELTITLPKKLLKHMKLQSRTRKQDLQTYIISQLNDTCLNLR